MDKKELKLTPWQLIIRAIADKHPEHVSSDGKTFNIRDLMRSKGVIE